MRQVLPTDLDRCARVLMASPEPARRDLVARIIGRADLADRYRKRLGRALAGAGDGTLSSATQDLSIAARPGHCSALYCDCLALVLAALADWRQCQRTHRNR